jgi:hypothetical protein
MAMGETAKKTGRSGHGGTGTTMSASGGGGSIRREACRETDVRSGVIVRGRATGEGTGTATAKGDAIGRGVVSASGTRIDTSGTRIDTSGERSGTRTMRDHTHGSAAGVVGAGHRTTSKRGDETKFGHKICAL